MLRNLRRTGPEFADNTTLVHPEAFRTPAAARNRQLFVAAGWRVVQLLGDLGPLRERWGRAAIGRAQRLVAAPVAEPARLGPELPRLGRPLDGLPQRQQRALEALQLLRIRPE